jgi:hypothetical protein
MILVQPVESTSVFSWWAWIIIGQVWSSIGIMDLLLLWWLGAIGVVDLNPAEISVFRTLQIHIIQHALVINTLCIAAAIRDEDEIRRNSNESYD